MSNFNHEFHQILGGLPSSYKPLVLTLLTSRQVSFTSEDERLIVDVFLPLLVENYSKKQDLIQTLQIGWLNWCDYTIRPDQIEFRHTPELWEN